MANTERLKTIRKIRDAKNSVGSARNNPSMTNEQLAVLGMLCSKLDDLEAKLIYEEIVEIADVLIGNANELTTATVNMKKSIEELKKVAKNVDIAAKAIEVLVDIAVASAKI